MHGQIKPRVSCQLVVGCFYLPVAYSFCQSEATVLPSECLTFFPVKPCSAALSGILAFRSSVFAPAGAGAPAGEGAAAVARKAALVAYSFCQSAAEVLPSSCFTCFPV